MKSTIPVTPVMKDDVAVREVMSKPAHVDRDVILPARIDGVVIGCLRGINADGVAQVNYAGVPDDEVILAQSTVPVSIEQLGKNIALSFLNNDPRYPVILGFMQMPQPQAKMKNSPVDVSRDGERLILSAEKEIELKCGESSITLTRAGKVIIKGTYVTTHSKGVNRIKGGSVQLN